jgi:A/G-specific adenine glycosylase
MLQQTQVKTVLPRYAAWFKHFPTIQSLAAASLDEVLKVWEGLGYYRRARFIHRSAQLIVDDMGGSFPSAFDDMISLPGIGRSTAGAISSFCFDTSTPVLDGNVKRVLKRWHGKPLAMDKELWILAQQAIDLSNNPASWNQAMMELGATVCGSKSASCGVCPVSSHCESAFRADSIKTASKRVPVHDVHWQVALHVCPEKGIWLTQRPDSGIWAGLWTPPIIALDQAPDDAPCHVHLLTHRRLHLYGRASSFTPDIKGCWVKDFSKLALPTGIHRLLEKHGIEESG